MNVVLKIVEENDVEVLLDTFFPDGRKQLISVEFLVGIFDGYVVRYLALCWGLCGALLGGLG